MSEISERQSNRERYPDIAHIVDTVREHFPGAKVVAIRPISEEKKRLLEDYNRRHPNPENK